MRSFMHSRIHVLKAVSKACRLRCKHLKQPSKRCSVRQKPAVTCARNGQMEERKGRATHLNTSTATIALTPLTAVRQLSIFSKTYARAIYKAFVLITVSFNGVAKFLQARRQSAYYRSARECDQTVEFKQVLFVI